MSSEQNNISNPFGRNLNSQVKKPVVQQAPKVDTMREQIKKQLLDSLESQNDLNVKDLKIKSDELSVNLENTIYEITGKNSKDKFYREKTKKIITRLKGTRNNNVRILLKSAIIAVDDLCRLDDKKLDNDAYFNKIASDNNIGGKSSDVNVKGKLPKINIPQQSLDLLKSNAENQPKTMEDYYKPSEIENSENIPENNRNSEINPTPGEQNNFNDLTKVQKNEIIYSENKNFNNFGEVYNNFNDQPNMNLHSSNDFFGGNSNNFDTGHNLWLTNEINGNNIKNTNNLEDQLVNNNNSNFKQSQENSNSQKQIENPPSVKPIIANPAASFKPIPGNRPVSVTGAKTPLNALNIQAEITNNFNNMPDDQIESLVEAKEKNDIVNTQNSSNLNISYNTNNDNASEANNSFREVDNTNKISDKLSELKKLRQQRQNKNLNMPLTLKSNSNISNLFPQNQNKQNVSYFNNPNEIEINSDNRTDVIANIENLNVDQLSNKDKGNPFVDDVTVNSGRFLLENNSDKNLNNLNFTKNEISQNLNSETTENNFQMSENNINNQINKKPLDEDIFGENINNRNHLQKQAEKPHEKHRNPFDDSESNSIVNESEKCNFEQTENVLSSNIIKNFNTISDKKIDYNGEPNSYRRNKEKELIDSNEKTEEKLVHKLTFGIQENPINRDENNFDFTAARSNEILPQKDNDVKVKSKEILRDNLSEEDKKQNNILISRPLINSNNYNRSEKMIILETDLELSIKKNEIYQMEIKNLREKLTEIRLNMIKSNEEVLNLEISKLKSTVSMKEEEIGLLNSENANLKEKLFKIEQLINILNTDNSNYRKQVEKLLQKQQEEFKELLKNKIDEINNFRIQHVKSEVISSNNLYSLSMNANNVPSDFINPDNNLTENAANVYIREKETNTFGFNPSSLGVNANNLGMNINMTMKKENKIDEINNNLNNSGNFINNASNVNNIMITNDLNICGNNTNMNENFQTNLNNIYDENINAGNFNNEFLNYDNNYYNNRTNGNPNIIEEVGSDNYLNGNTYDEMKDKDDNLQDHEYYEMNNLNSNNNFDQIGGLTMANNSSNNQLTCGALNNYEEFHNQNKIGNTGETFNTGYNVNSNLVNNISNDFKKGESGATNATKDFFGNNEDEKNPFDNNSKAKNLFGNNVKNQVNSFFTSNTNMQKTSRSPPRGNQDRNNLNKSYTNNSDIYGNLNKNAGFVEELNSQGNDIFGNNKNLNQSENEIFTNEQNKLPTNPNEEVVRPTKGRPNEINKNNKTGNNYLGEVPSINNNNDNVPSVRQTNNTSNKTDLFGDDNNEDDIFSKGLSKLLETDKKVTDSKTVSNKPVLGKNPPKFTNSNDLNSFYSNNLNNSTLSEKNDNSKNQFLNNNANDFFNQTSNSNKNNLFNDNDANNYFTGNKKENSFAGKSVAKPPLKQPVLSNMDRKTDNKPNNKRVNIFDNNHFENDKNAFDFFDKKDDNAGNIFESLSRGKEDNSSKNKQGKGSGLFE